MTFFDFRIDLAKMYFLLVTTANLFINNKYLDIKRTTIMIKTFDFQFNDFILVEVVNNFVYALNHSNGSY